MSKNPGKQERARIKKHDSAHRKMPRHSPRITNQETIHKFYKHLRDEKTREANEYREKLLSSITEAEHAFENILVQIKIDYKREYIVLLRDTSTRFIDFYSPIAKIGFEIDGGYHKERIEYDIDRDIGIMSHNILLARFTNDEVLEDRKGTKSKVEETLWNRVKWWRAHGQHDRMSVWEANQPNRHP